MLESLIFSSALRMVYTMNVSQLIDFPTVVTGLSRDLNVSAGIECLMHIEISGDIVEEIIEKNTK